MRALYFDFQLTSNEFDRLISQTKLTSRKFSSQIIDVAAQSWMLISNKVYPDIGEAEKH